MLQLREIKKTYRVGEIETKALRGISVSFREKEFVAILGASGSGKTTCLNIIGGLDRYDSGDLVIKGKHTSSFKDRDWDAYRNNSIGFVFQSYNLISHLSIVANVELGMTLSGVSSAEKRRRALQVLEEVGLKEHLHKKPTQLSGGQMQRVAIARALANNPEILLCDEPTGALDSETSVQIMDLIKELSKDRLVIMVTHNADIATRYASRIINFQDGLIVDDSAPYNVEEEEDKFSLKHTSMSFFTALRLSFNNIMTKKGRTFLTAFASSIGIIGIAVILSLSNGFQLQIDNFQKDALSEFPIIINQMAPNMDPDKMQDMIQGKTDKEGEYPSEQVVNVYDSQDSEMTHKNDLSEDYLKYISKINPEIVSTIGYSRMVGLNLLKNDNGTIKNVKISEGYASSGGAMGGGVGLPSSFPQKINPDPEHKTYLENHYDVLAGTLPKESNEMMVVVDSKNRLDVNLIKQLGFDVEAGGQVSFSDILSLEMKVVPNDVFYTKISDLQFLPSSDLDAAYKNEGNIEVKITGIVRLKESSDYGLYPSGVVYSDQLPIQVVDMNKDSEIVKVQKEADVTVVGVNAPITDQDTKDYIIVQLGGSYKPIAITIYPVSFESKGEITKYLDDYNTGKSEEQVVVYTDYAETITNLTGGIMDAITIVLIAFASISLVVSLIMIAIITYISVLERTKEIGVLRALGARKKDISRVFDAETFILGLFSGLLGVAIAYALTFPINIIIKNLTDLGGVAQLNPLHALILVGISTFLTVLGGHIPAKIASRKDAVEALRND